MNPIRLTIYCLVILLNITTGFFSYSSTLISVILGLVALFLLCTIAFLSFSLSSGSLSIRYGYLSVRSVIINAVGYAFLTLLSMVIRFLVSSPHPLLFFLLTFSQHLTSAVFSGLLLHWISDQ
ncbi:hypothetical protein P9112_012986 [Eukaryota sp. TZLM1-RC]